LVRARCGFSANRAQPVRHHRRLTPV
jgi:hypothetical protein